jgi:transcriptional regulator with GAF, ATPase, and Fis domain
MASGTFTPPTRVLSRAGREVALRKRFLRLEVRSGPDHGKHEELSRDRIVIGTHPSCDIELTDPAVSRQHCEIATSANGWIVRDLASTNGTYIERMRVVEAVISRKARLQLGETTVVLTPLDRTIDVPLGGATRFGGLVGASPAMRQLFEQLEQVAGSDATVMLLGESGTGKELAARALHEASPRASGPFQVIDCGALSGTLIESELYGHVRGAFTGASRSRVGAFEAAQGGTVFLDEIGELPLDQQAKLLGVLERKRLRPVGSERDRPIDVRLIVATNRDLRREINRGGFRADLFFRLAVVMVDMPPLRDHPQDIPLLVEQFLPQGAFISTEALEKLQQQPWPGNVRELRNAVERAAVGAWPEEETPVPRSTPSLVARVDVAVPFKTAKALLIDEFEQLYLRELMLRHRHNISIAAKVTGLDRVHLLRLLDKYALRPRR